MANTNNKISIFVGRQLPEFVRENNNLFVEFLEAYYEYMEQSNTTLSFGNVIDRSKNLLKNLDVDTVELDEFSEKLYLEFLNYFPKDTVADRNLILKNVKDFYRSRGTEKSFKFLFKAIFGKDAEIYIPKNDILIASSGKWIIEKSLRISDIMVNGVSNDTITGLQMFTSTRITGNTSDATAAVERVLLSYEALTPKFELFVSGSTGTFTNGETIETTDVNGNELSATILSGSLASITITNTGSS